VKSPDSIRRGHPILRNLRAAEGDGILGVVVICVDIERNTSGEGGLLGCF
jgi:hypothetical protein